MAYRQVISLKAEFTSTRASDLATNPAVPVVHRLTSQLTGELERFWSRRQTYSVGPPIVFNLSSLDESPYEGTIDLVTGVDMRFVAVQHVGQPGIGTVRWLNGADIQDSITISPGNVMVMYQPTGNVFGLPVDTMEVMPLTGDMDLDIYMGVALSST